MKLTSLKKSSEQKKKESKMGPSPGGPLNDAYPRFTRMTVYGGDLLKSVGLANVKAGDVLKLEARVCVKEVTAVDREDDSAEEYDRNRVEIQFEKMGVEPATDEEAEEGFREAEADDEE